MTEYCSCPVMTNACTLSSCFVNSELDYPTAPDATGKPTEERRPPKPVMGTGKPTEEIRPSKPVKQLKEPSKHSGMS
jgi:hypothetical protein